MRTWIGWRVLGLAAVLASGSAEAQSPARLVLGADRATVIDLKEAATKVAVANPAIADVQVITPTQLLVIGRGVGVTSLVVFHPREVRQFDLVVHGTPLGALATQPLVGAPSSVLVQRGDKVTEHFFSRDVSQQWVELGSVKVETEAPKPK